MITKTHVEQYFNEVKDPRSRKSSHDFYEILTIAICCAICGLYEWEDMVLFAETHYSWLIDKVGLILENGIPSEATFRRVLMAINGKSFELCFMRWAEVFREIIKDDILCIDGKTARGSRNKSDKDRAVHLLNVWSYENGVVIGQQAIDKKTNEITAIPEMLELLFIEGCTVTIDAMGCQKEIVSIIRKRKADYLISLKGNQGDLHKDVSKHLNELLDGDRSNTIHSYYEAEIELDHGRIEKRRCLAVTVDLKEQKYTNAHLWKDLKTVVIIESTRINKLTKKATIERRCFISSLECDAKKILETARAHWSIENSLHWILDVSCGEDDSKINSKNAPIVMSALRKIGVNFVKADKDSKRSFKKRQKKALMSLDYLEKILALGLLNHS
jgi:predicted transposase YbfD/YdcC